MSGIFTLSVECRLAASHVLHGCPPCDCLHGHTWTIRAYWAFSRLDGSGMAVDFHTLKGVLNEYVRERYDHRHLNDISPFDAVPATAENLAKEAFGLLQKHFDPGPAGRLLRVEVWEGLDACAAYEEAR